MTITPFIIPCHFLDKNLTGPLKYVSGYTPLTASSTGPPPPLWYSRHIALHPYDTVWTLGMIVA